MRDIFTLGEDKSFTLPFQYLEKIDHLNLTIKRESAEYTNRLLHSATCYILRFVPHFLRINLHFQTSNHETLRAQKCQPVCSRRFQRPFSWGHAEQAGGSRQCRLTNYGCHQVGPGKADCAIEREPSDEYFQKCIPFKHGQTCGDIASPPGTSGGWENST